MPSLYTVLNWLDKPEFAAAYARAREMQGDVMDAMILDAANECKGGKLDPKAANVAIGAYQWRAGRLAPKRYGDRQAVDMNVSGELGLVERITAGRKRAAE